MTKEELIWAASVAAGKRIEYENFMYSDYMYGNENLIDEVWEYVVEWNDYGEIAFREKYKDFKLY